jgi:hypothetical protein
MTVQSCTRLPMFAATSGSIWWMNRDLEEKQKRYGRKPKA